ncbi:MAG: cation transporter [Deltaproteobacteria bacterium]|nr:cation transporter [Deltaproteobacteria bacterium]
MKSIDDIDDEEMIDALLRIAPYASIAHHIPGRIRLKISLEGAKAINGGGTAVESIRIPGIRNTRINAFARSVVIEYDEKKIPYDLWVSLGEVGKRPDLALQIVNRLRALFSRDGG